MLRHLKNILFKQSVYVLSIKAMGVIMQFLSIFIITNNATPELFGKFSFLTFFLVLLGAICLLGMNNSFLQFSGKLQALNNFNEVSNLYKRMILILIFSFMFILMVYLLISKVFPIEYLKEEDVGDVIEKGIFALFPFSLSLLNFQVLRGLNKLYLSEISANLLRFGSLLILSIILFLFKDFELLLQGYILIFVLISVVTTIMVFKLLFKIEKTTSRTIGYLEILKISFPMSFSLISLLMMQSVDVFILERYWDFKIVGYYSTAVKVTTGIGIILATINAIIAPEISKFYFSKNPIELNRLIAKSVALNFILTVPVIIFIFLFSKEILVLFGDGYVNANKALLIMIGAQMINAFSGSVGVYLNMTGRQKIFLYILSIALIINITLNIILVPAKGMIGAAMATGISLVLWNFLGLIYVFKKDKINLSIFRFQF